MGASACCAQWTRQASTMALLESQLAEDLRCCEAFRDGLTPQASSELGASAKSECRLTTMLLAGNCSCQRNRSLKVHSTDAAVITAELQERFLALEQNEMAECM